MSATAAVPACPYCGAELTGAIAMTPRIYPRDGDVSVCLHCAAVGVFTGRGYLVRRPTRDELRDIIAEPEVQRAVAAVTLFNELRDVPGRMGRCCGDYPHICPGCQRVMSHREWEEQRQCNDCAGGPS